MTAGVILCGGQSSRMGRNKAGLIYSGKPMREHMKSVLQDAGMQCVYFSGPGGIVDGQVGLGPLSGISSCLNALPDEKSLLFVPVDMPLLSAELVSTLLKHHEQHLGHKELVRFDKQHFPFVLLNNSRVRRVIEQQLAKKELALFQLFNQLSESTVEPCAEASHFDNINTPEQWQQVTGQKIIL